MKKILILSWVFCISLQLFAQNRTITGSVTDSAGLGIPNVTVRVPGSGIGTSTDGKGIFKFSIPANTTTVEFSSIGFNDLVAAVPASGFMNVVLRPSTSALNEVVVTGITRTARSKFAGAATKLDAGVINNRPVGSLDQLFQGRVPGVLALTGSGAPGNSSTIIIRGQGSIVGGSTPLYIVDGIPVEAGVFQSLNPNDFESIDILRDAASTALYGSRGSSGVIVITTKRGSGGKMRVSYSGQVGVKQTPQFTQSMMTTEELFNAQAEYGRILNIPGSAANLPGWFYNKNNPRYATLSPAEQARTNQIYDSMRAINTNWRDVFFRDGSFQQHQISLSGGTGKTRVYTSIGVYSEEGITYRTDMKRGTLRNNIDYADEKFTLAVSSQLGYTKRNFQQSTQTNGLGNPFLVANVTAPYARLYNPDGTLATGVGNKFAGANTYDLTLLDENYSDQVKVTLSTSAAYKITNEISAGVTTGIDFRETQSSNYGNRTAFSRRTSTVPTTNAGFQSENLSRLVQLNVRPSVGYRKLFKNVHDVDVNVYAEYIKQAAKNTTSTGYGIDPRTPNTPAAIQQGNATNNLFANVGGGKNENALISGLITGRYTYDNKYTFTGSFRRDGSSKLPVDTRWQQFYAVGLIWEATREKFLQSNNLLSLLRLKVSYGSSGNSDNFPGGDYPYQATYTGAGSYAGLQTQFANYPGNPELKWETTYVTNIGIDFGLLKNRIWGDINLYDKRTKDLFVQRRLSALAGFDIVNGGLLNVNAGELQNIGAEVAVNGDIVRTKNTTFGLNFNFSHNHNEILSLGGNPEYPLGTGLIKVGTALGDHYEVEWAGVDAATGAPLYIDANGKQTTNINNAPRVQKFGTWEAPWKGGFGANFRYKTLELSTVFSFQKGAFKTDNLEFFMENPQGFLANGFNQAKTLDFWTKPGDVATTPSPIYGTAFSSKIIHNADFIRWRDVTLSYRLPQSVVSSLKFLSNARVYLQGTNLLIWTNWQGMDPEAGVVNINLSEFPNPRALTAGIDITF